MRHGRIDIRLERIFLWLQCLPKSLRLLVAKLDFNDGLDALVAVLPGHNDPDGRPMLLRERFPIDARHNHRQWVHRFVHAQTLEVWPWIIAHAARHARRLFGSVEGFEADKFRFWFRRNFLNQFA